MSGDMNPNMNNMNPMVRKMIKKEKLNNALIICDMQLDFIHSMSECVTVRESFLDFIRIVISVVIIANNNSKKKRLKQIGEHFDDDDDDDDEKKDNNDKKNKNNNNNDKSHDKNNGVVVYDDDNDDWIIIFTGLRFESEYSNVNINHRLFGAFKRLYNQLGCSSGHKHDVHWFQDGYDGSNIEESLLQCLVDDGGDGDGGDGDGDGHSTVGASTRTSSTRRSSTKTSSSSLLSQYYIVWRNGQHLPSSKELSSILDKHCITHVTVVGMKASSSVQSTCQFLCDYTTSTNTNTNTNTSTTKQQQQQQHSSSSSSCCLQRICVIKECVQDDNPERLYSMMKHLIPIYADIVSLVDFIDETIGLEQYEKIISTQERQRQRQRQREDDDSKVSNSNSNNDKSNVNNKKGKQHRKHHAIKYLCDCGRSGHTPLYVSHLLRRPFSEWQRYPKQFWYSRSHNSTTVLLGKNNSNNNNKDINDDDDDYYCPLGKRIISFCDEPQYSDMISMFINGREYLDEKDKLIYDTIQYPTGKHSYLIPSKTYRYTTDNNDNDTVNVHNTNMKNDTDGPWFVKETNKNGGKAIQVFRFYNDCIEWFKQKKNNNNNNNSSNNNHHRSTSSFIIQCHIPNPMLTDDGKKFHIKLYSLLINRNIITKKKNKDPHHHHYRQQQQQQQQEENWWYLYCYKDAFLSISPNVWNRDDTSYETQITTLRNERISIDDCINDKHDHPDHPDDNHDKDNGNNLIHSIIHINNSDTTTISQNWPMMYNKCKEALSAVITDAIDNGKLKPRTRQQRHNNKNDNNNNNNDNDNYDDDNTKHHFNYKDQFELFSTDLMFDSTGQNVYVIECNFTPVLYDPTIMSSSSSSSSSNNNQHATDDEQHGRDYLTTKGLRLYDQIYHIYGGNTNKNNNNNNKAQQQVHVVNDTKMIHDTISIAFYNEQRNNNNNNTKNNNNTNSNNNNNDINNNNNDINNNNNNNKKSSKQQQQIKKTKSANHYNNNQYELVLTKQQQSTTF